MTSKPPRSKSGYRAFIEAKQNGTQLPKVSEKVNSHLPYVLAGAKKLTFLKLRGMMEDDYIKIYPPISSRELPTETTGMTIKINDPIAGKVSANVVTGIVRHVNRNHEIDLIGKSSIFTTPSPIPDKGVTPIEFLSFYTGKSQNWLELHELLQRFSLNFTFAAADKDFVDCIDFNLRFPIRAQAMCEVVAMKENEADFTLIAAYTKKQKTPVLVRVEVENLENLKDFISRNTVYFFIPRLLVGSRSQAFWMVCAEERNDPIDAEKLLEEELVPLLNKKYAEEASWICKTKGLLTYNDSSYNYAQRFMCTLQPINKFPYILNDRIYQQYETSYWSVVLATSGDLLNCRKALPGEFYKQNFVIPHTGVHWKKFKGLTDKCYLTERAVIEGPVDVEKLKEVCATLCKKTWIFDCTASIGQASIQCCNTHLVHACEVDGVGFYALQHNVATLHLTDKILVHFGAWQSVVREIISGKIIAPELIILDNDNETMLMEQLQQKYKLKFLIKTNGTYKLLQ